MMTPTRDRATELHEIAPCWQIRQSEAGRWWANRDQLSPDQLRAGCRLTLDADDLDHLIGLIADQDKLASIAPRAGDSTTQPGDLIRKKA